MARKKNREKVTSAAEISRVMASAKKEIKPPAHVRMEDCDLPFFKSVLEEFARSEWTDHQLEIAALLARTMCDMERDQFNLRQDGTILYTEKNHPFINPLKGAVNQSAGSILAMRRSLSLHARAREGEARDAGKRKGHAKAAERNAQDMEDDLINMPSVH